MLYSPPSVFLPVSWVRHKLLALISFTLLTYLKVARAFQTGATVEQAASSQFVLACSAQPSSSLPTKRMWLATPVSSTRRETWESHKQQKTGERALEKSKEQPGSDCWSPRRGKAVEEVPQRASSYAGFSRIALGFLLPRLNLDRCWLRQRPSRCWRGRYRWRYNVKVCQEVKHLPAV